jgi:hypothetical protein
LAQLKLNFWLLLVAVLVQEMHRVVVLPVVVAQARSFMAQAYQLPLGQLTQLLWALVAQQPQLKPAELTGAILLLLLLL